MTIERHARFQPESVACRQTTGQNAFRRAEVSHVKQLVPELLSFVSRSVDFETVLAGVPGARNYSGHSIYGSFAKVVVLDLVQCEICQRFQNIQRIWSLQRNLTVLTADIAEFNVTAAVLKMRSDPVPIFLRRPCVYHQQQMVLCDAIDEQILDD